MFTLTRFNKIDFNEITTNCSPQVYSAGNKRSASVAHDYVYKRYNIVCDISRDWLSLIHDNDAQVFLLLHA